MDRIREGIANAHARLEADFDSFLLAADAICTTDRNRKIVVRELPVGSQAYRVAAMAKGAGMIEPNMATMLVFLLTDVTVPRDTARLLLAEAVDATFNRISVDGDMSTSDMALLLSSRLKPAVAEDEWKRALTQLCRLLAEDVVRNGEGTGHVVHVTVRGLADDAQALGAAKAVVNSPLVKTAVYGNDPNVGRILSAVGDYAGNHGFVIAPERVRIAVGEETVFADGAFVIDQAKEIRLSEYLKTTALNPRLRGYPQHQRRVELDITCGSGPGEADAIGADLSDQYVRENADYRT